MRVVDGFWLAMKLNLLLMHSMSKWILFASTILLLCGHILKSISSEVSELTSIDHITWTYSDEYFYIINAMTAIHYLLRSIAVTQTLTGSLDPSSAIPVETKHCGNINGQMGEDQVSRFLFKSVLSGVVDWLDLNIRVWKTKKNQPVVILVRSDCYLFVFLCKSGQR